VNQIDPALSSRCIHIEMARNNRKIRFRIGLNRAEELRLHLRAAANNGVTRKEIQEVLLQAAIYCGVPAANSAFHIAEEVFAESGK